MTDLPKTLTEKQAMFDAAYIGLAGQGFEKSLDGTGRCRYRGDDGLKCAIGHCIPDDLYDANFERKEAGELLIISSYLHEFAGDLQWVHDHSLSPDHMIQRLHILAKDHDLTIPSIEGQS